MASRVDFTSRFGSTPAEIFYFILTANWGGECSSPPTQGKKILTSMGQISRPAPLLSHAKPLYASGLLLHAFSGHYEVAQRVPFFTGIFLFCPRVGLTFFLLSSVVWKIKKALINGCAFSGNTYMNMMILSWWDRNFRWWKVGSVPVLRRG